MPSADSGRRPDRPSVVFVLRSDSATKGGGDISQLKSYVGELRKMGWDVETLAYRRGLTFTPGTIVHLANIDRTYEFLDAYRRAELDGARIFVSPIHHDLTDTRRMRRHMFGAGLEGVLNRVLPERVREALVYYRRCIPTGPSLPAVLGLVRMALQARRAMRNALNQAERVFLLAPGEGESLTRDFGWSARNGALTPNGLPTATVSTIPWADRPQGSMMVVGRIEPRKRTLELLRAANASGIPLDIYGPPGEDSKYVAAFLRLVADGPSTWHGGTEHAAVLSAMQGTRVLVNASWIEVQSLVDLEAAQTGCWVVTSPTGHSHSWLPEAVRRSETWAPEELLGLAHGVAIGDDSPTQLAYTHTWRDAATRIALAYEGQEPNDPREDPLQ